MESLISPEHPQQHHTNESFIMTKITCIALHLFMKLSSSETSLVPKHLRHHHFCPLELRLSVNDESALYSTRGRNRVCVLRVCYSGSVVLQLIVNEDNHGNTNNFYLDCSIFITGLNDRVVVFAARATMDNKERQYKR